MGGERLKIMWARELKTFTNQGEDANALLADTRCAMLCLIGELLEHFGAKLPGDWFKAVAILDISTLRVAMALEDVPARCAAIVSILRKADTSEYHEWLMHLVAHAGSRIRSLHVGNSMIPGEISAETISRQERQILGALGWQIEHASVETWISAFCGRFDTIEKGSLRPSIQWMWQSSISYARYICTWRPLSEALRPRSLAQGILCIFVVMAHLVSHGFLWPSHVETQDWFQLFHAVPMDVPSGTKVSHEYLSSLLLATDSDLEDLKNDTHTALMLVRDMANDGQVAIFSN